MKTRKSIFQGFKKQQKQSLNFEIQIGPPFLETIQRLDCPFFTYKGALYDQSQQEKNIFNYIQYNSKVLKEFSEYTIETTAQDENKIFMMPQVDNIKFMKLYNRGDKVIITLTQSGLVQLWDLQKGKFIETLNQDRPATLVSFSKNFDVMASYNELKIGNIGLWSLCGGEQFLEIKDITESKIILMTLNANGTCLAVCDENRIIKLFKTRDGEQIMSILSITNIPRQIIFVSNKQLVISNGNLLTIWNLNLDQKDMDILAHDEGILFMELNESETTLYTASADCKVRKWALPDFSLEQTNTVNDTISTFSISKSGTKFVCGTMKGFAIIVDTQNKSRKIFNFQTQLLTLNLIENTEELVFTRDKNEIILYNYPSQKIVSKIYGHKDNISVAVYSQITKQLITCENSGDIFIWSLKFGNQINFYKQIKFHQNKIVAACLHPSQKQLAVGSEDMQISIWNCLNWNNTNVINFQAQLFFIKYSITTPHFVFACKKENLQFYNSETYEKTHDINFGFQDIYDISFHPSKKQAVLTVQKSLIIYEIETEKRQNLLVIDKGNWNQVTFSQNGQLLCASSSDGKIRIWNYSRKYLKFILSSNQSIDNALLFVLDDEYIVTGDQESLISIWNTEDGNLVQSLNGHQSAINSLSQISQNEIVSCSDEGLIIVWKIGFQDKPFKLEKHKSQIQNCLFSLDSKLFYVVCSSSTLKVYNTETWQQLQITLEIKSQITTIQVLPDSLLAIGDDKGKLIIFDPYKDTIQDEFQASDETIRSLIVANNSQQIGYINGKTEIIVKELQNESQIIRLEGHKKGTEIICFFEKRNQLISSGADNLIFIWDLTLSLQIKTLSSHKDTITSLSLHPTQDILVSSSYDEKIIIWNIQTEERIKTMSQLDAKFNFVRFSQDGQTIIANTLLSGAKIYSASTGDIIAEYPALKDVVTTFNISQANDKRVFGLINGNVIISPQRKPILQQQLFSLVKDFVKSSLNTSEILKKFMNKYAFEKTTSVFLNYLRMNFLHLLAYSENFQEFDEVIKNLQDYLKFCDDDQDGSRLVTCLFCSDKLGKSPFDIILLKKNQACLEQIIDLFRLYPPLDNAIYSTEININFGVVIQQLIKIGVRNIYVFLDSRLFELEGSLPKMAEQEFEQLNIALVDNCGDLYPEKQAYQTILNELKPYIKNKSKAKRIQNAKIDIPNILSLENEFLVHISGLSSSDPVYGCRVVKAVVNYKWFKYAKSKFLQSCIFYLFTTAVYTYSANWIIPKQLHEKYLQSKDTLTPEQAELVKKGNIYLFQTFIPNAYLILFFLQQGIRELLEMKQRGFNNYFNQGWNILDLITVSLTLFLSIFDLIIDFVVISMSEIKAIKIISSINLLIMWCRLISFLRGFDSTAFLITMIIQVIKDMKSFILVVLYAALAFSFAAFIIQDQYDFNQLQMFQFTYQFIIGDSSNFNSITTKLPEYLWILYLLCSFLTIIVLMNLLISILGDTYGNVSSQFELANNFEKIQLIIDIDKFNKKSSKIRNFMKKYLINITFLVQDLSKDQIQQLDKKLTIKLKNIYDFVNQNFQRILSSLKPLEEMSSRNQDAQDRTEDDEKNIRKLLSENFSKVEVTLNQLTKKVDEFRKFIPTPKANYYDLDFS